MPGADNGGRLYTLSPFLTGRSACSPNILRTVRRTMFRFLIELLVRRTWFRQFDERYFVLNWLVMRCKLRPELATEAQQQRDPKCRLKSSQYTLIIPHRVIQLLYQPGSQRQGCTSHKSTSKNIPFEVSEVPICSDIVIHFIFPSSSSTGELSALSQSVTRFDELGV